MKADATVGDIFDGINRTQGATSFTCHLSEERTTAYDIAMDAVVAAHTGAALPPEVQPVAQAGIREANGLRARLIGIFNQTITKDSVNTLDWLIPQLTYAGVDKKSYFDGIEYFMQDGVNGDKCTFEIVDKDGTGVTLGLYPQAYYDAYKDGNGVLVVEEFGTDWPLIPNYTGDIILYKARLLPGLYIRAVITSTGTVTDPYLTMGIFRHLDENS
jgi:hypothetical protein